MGKKEIKVETANISSLTIKTIIKFNNVRNFEIKSIVENGKYRDTFIWDSYSGGGFHIYDREQLESFLKELINHIAKVNALEDKND